MSNFEVKVVKIDAVENHPNADRLSIIKIGGFDCISGKLEDGSHRYNTGDLVVYIPEAAVVPEWILRKLGFWDQNCGTLSGSHGNRVKAIKLRKIVSQGILFPVTKSMIPDSTLPLSTFTVHAEYTQKDIDELRFHFDSGNAGLENEEYEAAIAEVDALVPGNIRASMNVAEGDDVAAFLGITKYEPTVPVSMQGKIGTLFGYTKSYDIENLQKNMNAFEENEPVVMTEKLHGTLCQVGYLTNLPEEKANDVFLASENPKIHSYVTSKGLAKSGLIQKNSDDNQENIYVKAYKDYFDNEQVVNAVKSLMEAESAYNKASINVYVFGEVFGKGIQDLGYDTEPTFNVFDVYVSLNGENNGYYLNDKFLEQFCTEAGLNRVPVLYRGPYSIEKATEVRDGKTTLGNKSHIREGIVIRPTIEKYNVRGLPDGRLQLKFVSPDYLLRKDGTEFN